MNNKLPKKRPKELACRWPTVIDQRLAELDKLSVPRLQDSHCEPAAPCRVLVRNGKPTGPEGRQALKRAKEQIRAQA